MSHLYVLGQTGVGKSTFIEQLALQDFAAGRGFAVIDPHGDLAERLAERMRSPTVRYFDATNSSQPFGYNPLRRVRDDKIPLAASGLLEAFKKLWPDAWGVRMEHVFRNSLYALLERDGSTLPDVLRLYSDKAFRRGVLGGIRNPVVRAFWKSEFANYSPRYAAEALSPIQNKLGALLSDPMLYRVLVNPQVDLHLRAIMDKGGVLLVNLAKGRIGADSATTLGSLLVSTLGLAALSRAEAPAADRRPFFVYVDEFQNFATLSFANMAAELRKYGVGLTLANQHLHQLEPEIRHAILGNAGTPIAFRLGVEDAAILARHFEPAFSSHDLLNLPNRSFNLRLMIDGTPSPPFSGELAPLPKSL
ncbi:MAG TPA: TraM recognition domain-containing protein [Allosphingosinicella sp.]|nr:TraM recognition domain-containing protein [Allosphingosinicella sp.]